MSTLVVTTADKAQRDKMFAELRASTDPQERQVVKFSHYDGNKSIWSVAYPNPDFPDSNPTPRRARKNAQIKRERLDDLLLLKERTKP